MMSTFGTRALSTLLAVGLSAALAGCDQANPTVSFHSMAIQRLGLEATDYLATCQVTNPNGFAMQIEEVRWTLTAKSGELISGEIVKKTELPADKTIPFRVHLEVPCRLLDRAGLVGQRQFEYQFGGQFRFSGPLGSVEAPFTTTGRMPIIREMKIAWKSIQLIGVTESRVGLALEAEITNTNDLFLTPAHLVGQLLINERPLVDIDTELAGEPPIPPQQSAQVHIPIWVSSPEVGVRTLSKLVAAPESRFRLVGSMELRIPGSGDVNDLLAGPPISAPDGAPPEAPAGPVPPPAGPPITAWPLP